ncbi:hypothetical protein TWF192_006005 [Orbilia oligospora]|nr:hypothetical protein TWF192_006005 [Orbilia oligospora]
MLRSLLYQLCDNDSGAYRAFLPRFRDKEKKHGHSWEWREDELETILLEFIASSTKPVVLLVDALDECDESEVRMAVNFLETLSSVSVTAKRTLNVCLSSRHYPTISMAKKLDLTIEGIAGHNKDISIYVEAKLRIDDDDIKYELCNKAEGLFMWVILVVGFLNRAYDDGDIDAVWIRLRELPPDLDAVFSTLLEIDNPEKHRTVSMLEFMLFCKGSLAPIELYYAVKAGTKPESLRRHGTLAGLTDKIIKNFIINHSRGLIETSDPPFTNGGHQKIIIQLINTPDLVPELISVCEIFGRIFPEGSRYPCGQDASLLYAVSVQNCPKLLKAALALPPSYEVNVDALGGYFGTPLQAAISIWANDIIQILLDAGADLNVTGGKYFHVLQTAIHCTPMGIQDEAFTLSLLAKLIGAGADVNANGGEFGTALQAAAVTAPSNRKYTSRYIGYDTVTKMIEMLLDAGADVNVQGGTYGNVLQAAVANALLAYNDDREPAKKVVMMLIEAGADVNAQGGFYGNALQAAARLVGLPGNGDYIGYEVSKMLLDAGSNVNAQGGPYGSADVNAQIGSQKYSTPLALACGWGWMASDLIENLLNEGADVNARSRDGSAVDAAFIRGCFDVQSRRFNKVSRVEGSLSILRRLQLAGAAGAVEAEQKLTKYRDWVSIQVSQGRKRSELPYDLYLQETSRSMLA